MIISLFTLFLKWNTQNRTCHFKTRLTCPWCVNGESDAPSRHMACSVRMCACVCTCLCQAARHLTNTPERHVFEWHFIVWSGAFISTLLNVSARKVSFFDAPRSSLIWQKCHPVVTSQAIPRSSIRADLRCAHAALRARKLNHPALTKEKQRTTQYWLLDFRLRPPGSRQKETLFVLPAAPSCGNCAALVSTQSERASCFK